MSCKTKNTLFPIGEIFQVTECPDLNDLRRSMQNKDPIQVTIQITPRSHSGASIQITNMGKKPQWVVGTIRNTEGKEEFVIMVWKKQQILLQGYDSTRSIRSYFPNT